MKKRVSVLATAIIALGLGYPLTNALADSAAPAAAQTSPGDQSHKPQIHRPAHKASGQKRKLALSDQQTAQLRETVKNIRTGRINTVDFHVAVGAAVPQTTPVYPVPVQITQIAPQFGGLQYLLIADNLIVVDPSTHTVVAIVTS